ncbi:MAG TPA: RidA family protein [Acidimicrobiales bacterium]|nr:RidA family protein [Acidimicrobiales bacterium]
MQRTVINPWPWSVQWGFDQATLVESPSKIVFCSGQTAIDADGNPQHPGDMTAQLTMAYENLAAVLADAGMTLDNVVRITAFTTDMDAFLGAVAAVQANLGRDLRNAFTLIGVSRLALPDLLVELEAIAVA